MMNFPLSPGDLALLCHMARFDPPKSLLPRVGRGLTAGELARSLALNPPCAPFTGDDLKVLGRIESCRALSDLTLFAYENDNAATGFVGYAFQGKGFALAVFRSSESTPCAPTNVDWLDNLRAPFAGSVQYPAVCTFVQRMRGRGPILFTGHSKGGHNALYALACRGREGDLCLCFDAQGFAPGQLDKNQRQVLKTRALNYVQRRDVVGALLQHPERRVFVAVGDPGENPHSLFAMAYDLSGRPAPARRSLLSLATEPLSLALLPLISRLTGEKEAENACPLDPALPPARG